MPSGAPAGLTPFSSIPNGSIRSITNLRSVRFFSPGGREQLELIERLETLEEQLEAKPRGLWGAVGLRERLNRLEKEADSEMLIITQKDGTVARFPAEAGEEAFMNPMD